MNRPVPVDMRIDIHAMGGPQMTATYLTRKDRDEAIEYDARRGEYWHPVGECVAVYRLKQAEVQS